MPEPRHRAAYFTTVGALPVVIGAYVAAWAVRADTTWFDRHWLENYCPRDRTTLTGETVVRGVALGVALALAMSIRPRLQHWAAQKDARELATTVGGVVVAAALALGFCDFVLRKARGIEDPRRNPDLPPMHIDATGNLAPLPASARVASVGGRRVLYATDADGNRAARVDATVDRRAASIVFAGESFAMGWGVPYEKTCAALVGAALGMPTVNLAVAGFSSDQAYGRLRHELPKLARPLAVVTFVLPDQLQRTVSAGRDRLALSNEGRLELLPAQRSLLATSPLGRLLPYHSDEAVPLSRAILQATAELARARGAQALFVFTQYGAPCVPEDARGSWLERSLFDDLGAPHVRVDIPSALTIASPTDRHPTEEGHALLAAAIIRALAPGLPASNLPR